MNGRIFDPVLGRFLSADPNIDGVSDSQGYNRYSYVINNPLNATDPSGYLTLREVIPAIVAVVVTVVVTVYAGPAAGVKSGTSFFGMLSGAAAGTTGCATAVVVGAAAGGFASGFSGSLLNGGSIGDAFKAGLIGGATGAFTAWASMGIGGFWGHNPGEFDIFRELGRAMSHGLVGGAVSEATGGEFRHGFYSSGASSMFGHSPLGKRLMSSNLAVSTAASMAVGGTVSVIGGGKFANGAVTSAFQHLFNQVASQEKTVAYVYVEKSIADGTDSSQGKLMSEIRGRVKYLNDLFQKNKMSINVQIKTWTSLDDLTTQIAADVNSDVVHAGAFAHGIRDRETGEMSPYVIVENRPVEASVYRFKFNSAVEAANPTAGKIPVHCKTSGVMYMKDWYNDFQPYAEGLVREEQLRRMREAQK